MRGSNEGLALILLAIVGLVLLVTVAALLMVAPLIILEMCAYA